MKTSIQGQSYKCLLLLTALLLSSCAHVVNTLSDVKTGMDREQALERVIGRPTPYFMGTGNTEYVLYRVTTNIVSMHGDTPHDILFIRFENKKVVDKGAVDSHEEKRIREINPVFVLRQWQNAGAVPADQFRK